MHIHFLKRYLLATTLLVFAFAFQSKAESKENSDKWAPDFLIIGAQKAGTTALFHMMIQHPKIVKREGEIHFFDKHFFKGVQWYRDSMPARPSPDFVLGEKTPYYMFHPQVAKRVHVLFPKVKIICILRNPVERAYSQYWFNRRAKREPLSFEEAIKEEPKRLAGQKRELKSNPRHKSYEFQHYSYLARGLYAEQLEPWLSLFPKEQIHIVSATDLRNDPVKVLNKIFAFLGLPDHDVKVSDKDRRRDYPPMDAKLRKELVEYFSPHNRQLEDLLNMKFDWK